MKKYIFILLTILVITISKNVYAYNMKGWNTTNTIVYNIDSNNYTFQSFISPVIKARWGIDNQTFQNGEYYQISTNITTIQKNTHGASQLRNCAINVNGAYINAVNYYNKINSECGETQCQSNYNITSYFNGENLTNVPVFVQCDLYLDAQFSSINYNYTISHEQASNNNDSAIISAITNNGQQIVNTNNYNANQNNANRDSNTNKVIDNMHSIASEYSNMTKVCSLKDNTTITYKKDETLNQNCYLDTVSGVCLTDTNYVTTDFIEVKPNTTYRFYASSGINGTSISSTNTYRVLGYEENKTAVTTRNTFSSGGSNTITTNANTKYLKISFKDNFFTIKGSLISCTNGNQAINEEQQKQTNLLSQIKDTINNTYNLINTNISNLLSQISSGIQTLISFFISTELNTSRLNALINRLQDSSPPIFSILTSLKNYVQSFNPNTTCQPVTIPLNTRLNNHNITLPCGTTLFWNRQDVSTFKTWWNLFVGGLLIYSVGLKLIKVIDGAFDPQKDEVGKGLEV